MLEMSCDSKTYYHCACAGDSHGNVMYVIRTLNSVYLSLFLDMSPSRPDPRCPLVNEMSQHIYTTYVSGILGLGGGGGVRVVDAKEDNIQLRTLTLIYKIVSCRRG